MYTEIGNAQWQAVLRCLPAKPHYAWDWETLHNSFLAPLFAQMAQTEQHFPWHKEGDVWTHTRMVCEALAKQPTFQALPVRQQQEVAFAALMHDVGKISCTREEDGILVSPGHASAGAHKVRKLLWQTAGLSGDPQAQGFRETVCLLIRYHSRPLHLLDGDDPYLQARKLAADAALVPDFSLKLLCLLAEADVLGRLCDDQQELLEQIQLVMELAKEAGCFEKPYPFPSAHTRHAYFAGKNVWVDQDLFDDTWGEVILLCGLPGTGKDTWLRQNVPSLPVVSLDEIRRQMRIKPTEPQGQVLQAAREQARVHLRAKEPFVWNATSLTSVLRKNQIQLFEEYHASVRIVYLETSWQENMLRNADRTYAVPEPVIDHMLEGFMPPEVFEARRVEWLCV